jgi:hypothetical protein
MSETTHEQIIAAITGATDSAVTRRAAVTAARKAARENGA